MTRAYLALGGNIGDVATAFSTALQALAAGGVRVVALSSVYRTPPWGVTDQPDFLNMVAAVDCDLSARALLELCLGIETSSGRIRDQRWGPRNIDIDVIAHGDEKIDEPDLTIPHPRAHERAFVLAPLAELAGDLMLGEKRVSAWLAQADASGLRVDEEATQLVHASCSPT